jgi:hypothetical protein
VTLFIVYAANTIKELAYFSVAKVENGPLMV